MTYIDIGIQGAKRSTLDEDDPRPVLARLIAAHPHADKHAVRKMFWDEIEDDKAAVEAMKRYWYDNAWAALHRSGAGGDAAEAKGVVETEEERRAAETEEKKRVREGKAEEAKRAAETKIAARLHYEAGLIMLDLTMPNNKPLGECTGSECRRIGGWLEKLAAKLQPAQKVAEVFTEAELYQIWKTTRARAAKA